MTPINWTTLAHAVDYYENLGYVYVDVPWIVDESISNMTYFDEGIVCNEGVLVGSGEQGFLAGDYPEGKHMTITPCFRVEDVHTNTTRPYFMKLELYSQEIYPDYSGLVRDAFDYMNARVPCYIKDTDIGCDIMCGDIELGSYGKRNINGRQWVYGTGLALPRITIATQGHYYKDA